MVFAYNRKSEIEFTIEAELFSLAHPIFQGLFIKFDRFCHDDDGHSINYCSKLNWL